MGIDLRSQLAVIAESFVAAVMTAMKGASLGDLSTETMAKRPATTRASATPGKAPARSMKAAVKPKAAAPAKAMKVPAAKLAKAKLARKPAGKADHAAVKDQLLAYVKAHPNERSEKVRAALQIERPVYLRAVGDLLEAKKIAKKGEKRKTTFIPLG